MRKPNPQSKQNKASKLQDFLNSYDAPTLLGILATFENSEAWALFGAYASMVQRQYEIEALDLMGKEGAIKSASFASGYAKGVEDVQINFMEGLRSTIKRVSPVVENVRPED